MERERLGVALSLAPVQLRAEEGRLLVRCRDQLLRGLVRERAKLAEELAPTFVDQRRELSVVISKEHEARGSGEFLAHEQHRRLRSEQRQCHQRAIAARRGLCMHAIAEKRVADLVVVLQKGDQRPRRHSMSRLAACLLLPRIPLALIEESTAYARDEFLCAPGVVAEVAIA